MNKFLLLTSLAFTTSLMAQPSIPAEMTIGKLIVEEVPSQSRKSRNPVLDRLGGQEPIPGPVDPTLEGRVQTAAQVITVGRDVVALGESIYELVRKGKPSNITEYAPISVVPKDPETKEHVDPFELEGFSMPTEKNFVARITDGTGREAVIFNYKLLYSYGGSYNGAGQYLTSVIVVPGRVVTKYGWDFNATMKLSGIMNHGSKANPVAGVMITIKYQMNSWYTSYERNDTLHITGRGEVKNYATGLN